MPLVSSPVHSIGEAGQWGSIPDVLDDRGVAVIEGCAFLGGIGRGIPPEESLTPRVVMRPGFEPLTAKELRAVVHYVRSQLQLCVAEELERSPIAVELVEACYRVEPAAGLVLTIEMHGPVHRRVEHRCR
jgi:hypothetical protein